LSERCASSMHVRIRKALLGSTVAALVISALLLVGLGADAVVCGVAWGLTIVVMTVGLFVASFHPERVQTGKQAVGAYAAGAAVRIPVVVVTFLVAALVIRVNAIGLFVGIGIGTVISMVAALATVRFATQG
jgi:uncharacterized membrane protein YdjX (TVP38/TMEM64 family)